MSFVLGISAFYHDSAACLIKNGEIIAAAQEERITRKKHDVSYSYNAINFVLNYGKLNLNLKVKFRESFRPFAPSILKEDLSSWFDLNVDSPYMLFVSKIKNNIKIDMSDKQKKLFGIKKLNIKRSMIPAVTHVDYSARIQTARKEVNKRYYDLLSNFKKQTGCPILVNTSFNVRGEPIVNSPIDAFNCFVGTDLDYLIIGNCILDKKKQNLSLKKDYFKEFELD